MAATPVPAAAPAPAPMAAPLPPPASAPITAPAPAPPPINTVSRFALPPAVCPAREVATTIVFPFTVTERSFSQSFAGVESLPDRCTLATTSFAGDPFGITTLHATATSLEKLPTTPWPTFDGFYTT